MTNTKMLHAGRRAVVGYEDGTVRIWDLKQGNSLHVLKGTKYYVVGRLQKSYHWPSGSLEHNTCILVISPLPKNLGVLPVSVAVDFMQSRVSLIKKTPCPLWKQDTGSQGNTRSKDTHRASDYSVNYIFHFATSSGFHFGIVQQVGGTRRATKPGSDRVRFLTETDFQL